MHCPNLLLSSPPSLSEQLRCKTDKLRSKIIRDNCSTEFAQTASELAQFRDATTDLIDGMHDDILSELFRNSVCFTSYNSYAPLIARFFEKPCKATAVTNLLAPGVPDYLVRSSSTSGGSAKIFPKYNLNNFDSDATSPDSGLSSICHPLQRRTRAHIRHFWCDPIHLEDENNCPVMTVYLASGSTVSSREALHLHPGKDREKMEALILDHTAPYAAGFIKKWRSLLVIHALFALCSRSLETFSVVFIGAFVDMMRHLDTEFDVVVDCIANGTIPDLDGIAEVRHYLEMNIFPDPERAAELRTLGRPSSRPGWCAYAWPSMHSVTAIVGGSFATSIPLARWFLGPNADILDDCYASSEAIVAYSYNPLILNQYKLTDKDIIEFLDINKSDSIGSLSQLWEVELGRRYEVVLTTQDGLWRYRIGDVVEISGFDPTDGVPIIQFVERRHMAFRFAWLTVSEKELRASVSFMATNIPVQVIGWATAIDDRRGPDTIGFFIELADDQVSNLALATEYVLDQLTQSNGNIPMYIENEVFRKPTIRLVQPGTFSDFLQLKLDEGPSKNVGQVKVPVVLPKAEYVTWFSNRVMREL